jgi:MFS family permease
LPTSQERSPLESSRAATRAALAIAPGVMAAGIAGGIAFPILPSFGLRAGLPVAFIGVILAANRAARVVANPFVGQLTDRIGGRRTLLLGLILQIVVMGFYWLGVRTGHPGVFFLVGRLIHGPGSSCVFVAGQALALEAGGAEHRGRVGGIVRAALGVGVPIGLVAGGVLSEAVGEEHTFEIASAALVVAMILALGLLPDVRIAVRKAVSIMAAVKGLADRRLAALGGLNFASTFAASGMVLTTMVFLLRSRHLFVLHMTERGTSSAFLGLLVIADAVSMPVFGRMGDRWHNHATIGAAGVGLIVPSLVVIALAHTALTLAVGVTLLGIGTGALGPSVLALVGDIVPPERTGIAIGVLQLCGDVGGAAGPLIGTALFASSVELPYFVSAGVVLALLPAAIWLARDRRRGRVEMTRS